MVAAPLVQISLMIGALSGLLISRYLFKNIVLSQIVNYSWFNQNFEVINELVEEQGVFIVALLRLSFTPFSFASYLMGVTRIKPMDFFVGNLSYFIYVSLQVFIGCSFYNINSEHASLEEAKKSSDSTFEEVVFVVEMVLCITLSTVVGLFSKKYISKKIKEH